MFTQGFKIHHKEEFYWRARVGGVSQLLLCRFVTIKGSEMSYCVDLWVVCFKCVGGLVGPPKIGRSLTCNYFFFVHISHPSLVSEIFIQG